MEEHRLMVFGNSVLRRLFGPKREEITEKLRKQQNEELHNLYISPSIIRMINSWRMNWAGHVAPMREKGNANKIFALGNPETKKSLGRHRCR
jgi:hypothetical protein